MHEQKPEKYFNPSSEFDRLTAPERIEREHQDIVDTLNFMDEGAIAEKQQMLANRWRQLSEKASRPRVVAKREDIESEMAWLDYYSGQYRHRAHDRKYAMERRPHELWLDASDTDKVEPITDLLKQTPRLSDTTFTQVLPTLEGGRSAIFIVGDSAHPIEVPTANIVSAESFDSWEEGRGKLSKMSDNGREKTSREVIEDYASRDTDVPPIESVVGYIQPNSLIVYRVKAGSHRAAAAIMRGDEYLATSNLTLVKLDQDLFSLSQTIKPA